MRKIAFITLLLISQLLVSQSTSSLSVSESDIYKDELKAKEILSIHTTSNGLTGIVRESKSNILFDVFDNSLIKTFSQAEKTSRKERFVGELFFENEIKFFTVYSPKKIERIIYCYVFNLENKSVKKISLFNSTVEKKQALFSGQNKRQTNFAISPNGKYFAVTTDNIKKNSNSYDVRIFDASNLKLLYKKAYQEDEKRFYEHNDLTIDDTATVYALGKLFINGKSEKKGGEANYEFVLNKISQSDIIDVSIAMDELHILSMNISMIKDQLHLLGFYSEQRVGKIKGGCNFIINTNQLLVSSSKTYELPVEIYKDLYGENRAKRKKGKELKSFYVDYVLQDEDNNTYILAEEFYVTQHYVNNGMNGGGYWVTQYHYDDVIVLKFNSKGELEWGRSIFKRSLSPSYNAFMKNNNLHVVLNSGKKLTEKKDGRTKVSKGFLESSALYDFVYDVDGNVSYDKIQDNKGNTEYSPFYGTYENSKFIMTSSRGGKKNKFMILQ